jgi:hypothetical protein
MAMKIVEMRIIQRKRLPPPLSVWRGMAHCLRS